MSLRLIMNRAFTHAFAPTMISNMEEWISIRRKLRVKQDSNAGKSLIILKLIQNDSNQFETYPLLSYSETLRK